MASAVVAATSCLGTERLVGTGSCTGDLLNGCAGLPANGKRSPALPEYTKFAGGMGLVAESNSAITCGQKRQFAQINSVSKFSALSFGQAITKRLKSAREALRTTILDGNSTGKQAEVGECAVLYSSPSRCISHTALLLADDPKRFFGLPPADLAEGLARPLPPPSSKRGNSEISVLPRPVWDVTRQRAEAAVPLLDGSPTRGLLSSPWSCPLGYLDYQTWLQRVVPEADLREAPKGYEIVLDEEEDMSGLELLRRLCRAARPKSPPRKRAIRDLSKEERETAEQSLDRSADADEVLASRFNVDLTRGQLQCLLPKTWLNDEVINFYFKLLQEKTKNELKGPQCWFANSFFWNKLSGGPIKHNSEYGYKEVRRWTIKAKVDIFALDYVIFPMNIGEMHWAAGAIDFKAKGFRYFDSMISRPHPNFVPYLRRYLCDEHKSKKGKEFANVDDWDLVPIDPPVPQQKNSYDCGVFTCFFADFFSSQRTIGFTQDDMSDLRLRLAARVVKADENWEAT